MTVVISSIFAEARRFVLDTGITWIFRFLLCAALFTWAVEYAPCQIDSTQILPQTFVVSKRQLLTPEKVQNAIERAHECFLQRRYELAQKEVQRALDICPHCALALTFQGIINMRARNYAEAAHAFQQAIQDDPSSGSAYLGLGTVYNTQGRFNEALTPLDRAAPFLPSSWLLHFENALAHLGVGESKAGLRDVAFAEGFTGRDPEKLSGVAYLRGVAATQLRDYNGARRYLEDAIRYDQGGTFATLAKKRLEQVGNYLSR